MVRLKGGGGNGGANGKWKFQFHNGSIKRANALLQSFESQKFQFHNGSIKRENLLAKAENSRRVSIPQWFD